jgi:hypothetical protein
MNLLDILLMYRKKGIAFHHHGAEVYGLLFYPSREIMEPLDGLGIGRLL